MTLGCGGVCLLGILKKEKEKELIVYTQYISDIRACTYRPQ